MDNTNQAPIIPAGTQNTAYGTPSFQGTPAAGQRIPDSGQAPMAPVQNQAGNAPQPAPQAVIPPEGHTTTYEELAAKKGFANADALANAYANLEARTSKAENSLGELIKARTYEDTLPVAPVAPTPAPVQQEVNTPEQALALVQNLIRKEVRPLEDRLALQDLISRNADTLQYASSMAAVVKENPGISWETAYRAAKFEALEQTAREQGRQEAYQTQQQKVAANVGGGVQTIQARQEASLEQMIGDRSIPFSEVQRMMRERFSQ